MDAQQFTKLTGRKPEQDDLERANCTKAGTFGHLSCGWCEQHNAPAWECYCFIARVPTQPSIAGRAEQLARDGVVRIPLPSRFQS